MKLPKINELVGKDKKVYFSFYRDGELWYKAENGFEFPIPKDDMKGAIFKDEDKSVFFMRFMKKHLDFLRESMDNQYPKLNDFPDIPPDDGQLFKIKIR